jgi:uncharacterized phage protein gp47/JayE
MTLRKKKLSDMTRDSLRYLAANTSVTYFSQGSIAKALVEATNSEISKLQDFVGLVLSNTFISSATGIYLDLFGEMLGVARISDRKASASIEDGSVRFYVDNGTLGARLRGPDPSTGLIPFGTIVSTADGSVEFQVTSEVVFPINAKSAFVPIRAKESGALFNVGANRLVVHNLNDSTVKVTNDITITTGVDVETDAEYRYRLSKVFTTKFGANKTAIQIAASSQAGVSRAELLSYSRGAGTFDVLLIPQGNRLTRSTIENTRLAVEAVTAYGINPTIREPVYVGIKIMAQLRFDPSVDEGRRISAKRASESGVLRYIASIPLGGELVINQLRSAILSSSALIKDVKIIELCLDGRQRVLSNIQLDKDELFIPDPTAEDAIEML